MIETTLDIRTPVKDILFELKKYHLQQIEDIDKMLMNATTNGSSIPAHNSIKMAAQEEKTEKGSNSLPNSTKIWFWEKNALEFINKYFSAGKFTTRELTEKVLGGAPVDKELHAKVIFAASLSLGKLKKAGKIKAEKEDGVKGFKYYL